MTIPSLARALLSGIGAPTRNASSALNIGLNSLLLDDTRLDIAAHDRLDVVFPTGVQSLVADPYTFRYVGTPDGFIMFKDDIIRVHSIDSSNKLAFRYQIKWSSSLFNTNSVEDLLFVGPQLILLLTSNKKIILIDYESGDTLFIFDLPFEFQSIHRIGTSNLFALYNSSCYFAIVQLNETNSTIEMVNDNQVIYLDFTPITSIKLPNDHLCVIGKRGNYKVFQFNEQLSILIEIADKSLKLTLLSLQFGDPAFGKIIKIENFNNSNSTWIVIQEQGWVIYQFSLMKIIEVISSPLLSSFESLVQLNNAFIIHMISGEMMLIADGNVQLISEKAIAIFCSNDTLWGLFKREETYLLKSFNIVSLSWIYGFDFSLNTDANGGATNITEGEFQIVSINKDSKTKFALKDLNGVQLCEFNQFKKPIRKVIDLRNVVTNSTKESNYLLVIESDLNITVLEFSVSFGELINSFPIKMENVSNVFYYEKINCLEFTDSHGASTLLNVKSLSRIDSTLKNKSKLNKILIFHIDDLSLSSNEIQNINNWNFSDNSTIIPLTLILNEPRYLCQLQTTFENKDWIGIRMDQLIITDLSIDYLKSPELALLYYVANSKLIPNWNLSISTSPHFMKAICQFCLSLDHQLRRVAFSFLEAILKEATGTDGLNDIYKKSIKVLNDPSSNQKDKLFNSLILGMIVSVDHSLYDKKVSTILMHYLITHLVTLDERVCEFAFIILLRLNDLILEKFKENPFDLTDFFKHIFELRSEFLLARSKRCFNSLKVSTDYIDSIFTENGSIMSIIIGHILSNEEYSLKTKLDVVDYLNYLCIEKRDILNGDFLLVTVNSMVCFLNYLVVKSTHIPDSTWEQLNLLFNIISNCFVEWLDVSIDLNKASQLDLKYLFAQHHSHSHKKSLELLLAVDLGYEYIANIYSFDTISMKWSLKLLKSTNKQLQILDNASSPQSMQDVSDVIQKIHQSLGQPVQRYILPCFSRKKNKVSIVDVQTMEILLWDLTKPPQADSLGVELLMDDNVPLKVPDFNMVALQSLWNKASLSKRFAGVDLMTAVSTFTRDENSNVYQPIGKVWFGDLLANYLSVFSDITYSDLRVRFDPDDKLLLELKEKPIFVYNVF